MRFIRRIELVPSPSKLKSLEGVYRCLWVFMGVVNTVGWMEPILIIQKMEFNIENLLLHLNSIEKLKSSTLAMHIYSKNGPASIIRNWERVRNCETLVRVKEKPEEEDMS